MTIKENLTLQIAVKLRMYIDLWMHENPNCDANTIRNELIDLTCRLLKKIYMSLDISDLKGNLKEMNCFNVYRKPLIFGAENIIFENGANPTVEQIKNLRGELIGIRFPGNRMERIGIIENYNQYKDMILFKTTKKMELKPTEIIAVRKIIPRFLLDKFLGCYVDIALSPYSKVERIISYRRVQIMKEAGYYIVKESRTGKHIDSFSHEYVMFIDNGKLCFRGKVAW